MTRVYLGMFCRHSLVISCVSIFAFALYSGLKGLKLMQVQNNVGYGRFQKIEPAPSFENPQSNLPEISDIRRSHLPESDSANMPNATIHIAMSICGDRGYEALISLKSAVLLTNSASNYEFHFFTDGSLAVEGAFSKQVKAHQKHGDNKNVNYKFYSVDTRNEIQSLFRPCSANRLIIAQELNQVSHFIYVDTDVIWLEDPANVFQEFAKFNESQELGFSYEIENDAMDETSFYHAVKSPLPIFGPNGINAGVAFFHIKHPKRTCAEFMQIASTYKSQLALGDQDVLNIYGNRHPEKIFRLGCQYNRRTDSKCKIYSGGIMHGNRFVFHSDLVQPFTEHHEYPLRFNTIKSIPVHGLDEELRSK